MKRLALALIVLTLLAAPVAVMAGPPICQQWGSRAACTNSTPKPPPTVKPTATVKPSATPKPTATPKVQQPVCDCSGNIYNCANFSTHAQAQACFNYCVSVGAGDVHGLDSDHDGSACESLP